MFLTLAVAAGLPAGLLRAHLWQRPIRAVEIHLPALAVAAFAWQGLAFLLPATRHLLPDNLAAAVLVVSQVMLLIFAWANRRQPGFWLLGLGLCLNFAVIAANGGLMPISPETLRQLAPQASPESWEIGRRLWEGKDVVLPVAATRLWWLSDRFLLPNWAPDQVAFSLGDVFIALGAFSALWAIGDRPREPGAASDEE